MICRIYHKTMEKKNPLFHGRQSYLLELEGVSSAATSCLPPSMESGSSSQSRLLECHTENSLMQGLQNSFLIHHRPENDLKRLIGVSHGQSHHLFPMNNGFHPDSSSATKSSSTNPSASPSMLFKSLLSHQDCTLKEQAPATTIPQQKQCKTETHLSIFDGSSQLLMDQPNLYNDHLFEMDYNDHLFDGGFTFSSSSSSSSSSSLSSSLSSSAAAPPHMSTSLPFNFQHSLHIPLSKVLLPQDSWPLDA